MRLEQDAELPERRRVLADDGTFIGHIHRTGPNDWRNTHVAGTPPLSTVPPGPFTTLDLAFDAFKKALASR